MVAILNFLDLWQTELFGIRGVYFLFAKGCNSSIGRGIANHSAAMT
jgi:hypothetical protein